MGARSPLIVPAVSLLIAAAAVRADQVESSAGCNEGIEPLAIAYGQSTTGCGISPATDLDSFRFQGEAGDVIRVCIRGLSNEFDVSYQLRDASNQTIDSAICVAGCCSPCGFCRQLPLEASGQYTILISDVDTDQTGNYVLQLERIPPVFVPTVIIHGATTTSAISPSTDLDFFRFEGVAGAEIRISVLGLSNNLDPRIEVLDPQGTEIVDQFCAAGCCSPCSFTVDRMLDLSGDYTIILSDQDSDHTGSVQISIQCLFGNCACLENDVDGDLQVGIQDLLVLLGHWGPCAPPCTAGCQSNPDTCAADTNRNCNVGVTDLLRLLASWGVCP